MINTSTLIRRGGSVRLLSVVLICAASMAGCRAQQPLASGDTRCAVDSAATAQLVCYITARGKVADTVSQLAQRVNGSLTAQPRVSMVSLSSFTSDGAYGSEVKFTFRGPRKLADRVVSTIIASQQVPEGHFLDAGRVSRR